MTVLDTKNNIAKFESVILNPRITEKSSDNAENNVYVFDVALKANKIQVKTAVKNIYKVDAVKVNIINIPTKKVSFRKGKGVKGGGKKAFVYLKEGDKIEII